MGRMMVKVWADEPREHVVVQTEEDGKPLAHVYFDGATAEQHAHNVAKWRALLKDEVARDLDPGSRLEAIVDPVWRVSGHRVPEGRILSLRHPGFGWLSFVLPDKEAAALAEWLTKDLPLSKSDKET